MGRTNQASNSIIIDATGTGAASAPTASACYILPIRSVAGPNVLNYNPTSFEVTYNPSSIEYKNNIQDIMINTSTLYGLKPRSFTYKADEGLGPQIGYITEEVCQVDRYFSTYDGPRASEESKPCAIDYNVLTVYLVEEIKKLNERILKLEYKV